jgi:hypothetical protein
MPILNKSWGILALGVPVTTFEYGRRFSEQAYKGGCRNAIQALVPVTAADPMAYASHVEELIKLLKRSTLKDRFEAFDTYNTYDKSTLVFPDPGLDSNSPVDLNPKFTGEVPVSSLRVAATISAGPVLTYRTDSDNIRLGLSEESYPINFTNGQSEDIPVVEGTLFLRFQDNLPALPFDIGLENIQAVSIDWENVLEGLVSVSYEFSDVSLKDTWNRETSFVERIAAFAMDVLETCNG